jgi:hypothetical protein
MEAESARAGVLLVRAWLEGESRCSLRARVVNTPNVDQNRGESAAAATIDDVLVIVHDWLEALLLSASLLARDQRDGPE